MSDGTAILGMMEFTMRCMRCGKFFTLGISDPGTIEVLQDAMEIDNEPLESVCLDCLRGKDVDSKESL